MSCLQGRRLFIKTSMIVRCVIILCVCVFWTDARVWVRPGPKYPPTKGEVWPKPQHQVKNDTVFTFNPAYFKIKIVGVNCSLLWRVVLRYCNTFVYQSEQARLISKLGHKYGVNRPRQPYLTELHVDLTAPCEEYPQYGMDESYNLTIAEVSTLRSASIWGIMRGFQTITHLLYVSESYKRSSIAIKRLVYLSDSHYELLIKATEIIDYPRYSHRGLLLDTSRHYISVRNILSTLHAMEMNKMNVFHWHIVDDQSFPYKSKMFPELSKHGAYHNSMVYSRANIGLIVNYARDRGIRVLPEFDVPGHTRSWGESHPEILTKCSSNGKVDSLGPMNPLINTTYDLLTDLFKEVQAWFPEKYLHVGGDEVDFECWASNPEIAAYMEENEITVKDLLELFESRLFSLLDDKVRPIVWQEIFDSGIPFSSDIPVQIWYEGNAKKQLNKVLNAGHKVIFSSLWYLDHLNKFGGDWEKYYIDPGAMVTNATLATNLLGGEACMWTETVDDRNVISRVWPRASAVAEILWSSSFNLKKARYRLEEHTCRMIRRGIEAQPPNGPGYCVK